MYITNNSPGIISIGGVTLYPRKSGTVSEAVLANRAVAAMLANGTLSEGEPAVIASDPPVVSAPAPDVKPAANSAELIESLKMAKAPRVYALCEQYGVGLADDEKLADIKARLIERIKEAG